MICDAHCHFFSSSFLDRLTADRPDFAGPDRASAVAAALQWDPPGTPEALADRWVRELDANGVGRAAIIASIPGDEGSVAAAVAKHPSRFVGFFMHNPVAQGAASRLEEALGVAKLRGICLFPAMHHYRLDDERVRGVLEAAKASAAVVFVHCGVLTVGVRQKLGLPSRFDLRLGDPLAVAALASAYPEVPVIIPHFGAGLFREALMAVEQCPNIHLDSSSSNGWMKYYPGLTLEQVFRQALAVSGPDRLLFGTDSSFFPRGWQRPIFEAQKKALEAIGADDETKRKIFGGTFSRLFEASIR
jgi:predicted TIM-barrel fold metal-dependent hydrolase